MCFFTSEALHYKLQALNNFMRFIQHEPIITGEVWFTFSAVHNNRVNYLIFRRGKFYVGGKSGAAKSDNSSRLDALFDFVRRDVVNIESLIHTFYPRIVLCSFYNDSRRLYSCDWVWPGCNVYNLARNRGVHVCRNKSLCFPDQLAFFYHISFCYNRLAGCANVLTHKSINGLGKRGG